MVIGVRRKLTTNILNDVTVRRVRRVRAHLTIQNPKKRAAHRVLFALFLWPHKTTDEVCVFICSMYAQQQQKNRVQRATAEQCHAEPQNDGGRPDGMTTSTIRRYMHQNRRSVRKVASAQCTHFLVSASSHARQRYVQVNAVAQSAERSVPHVAEQNRYERMPCHAMLSSEPEHRWRTKQSKKQVQRNIFILIKTNFTWEYVEAHGALVHLQNA